MSGKYVQWVNHRTRWIRSAPVHKLRIKTAEHPPIAQAVRDLFKHQFSRSQKKGTLWLFNIATENGPFIDGLPGFTYLKW